MKALARRFSPSATDLLRSDHARVVALFHRYAADLSPRVKRGLVENACRMLEIHAQIEAEIFYPAMRVVDSALVDKGIPEHEAIRVLAVALRGMDAADPDYDDTFLTLMRAVLHHVADEETRLFPDAERLFPEDLPRMGAEMARRRLQLGAPRIARLAGIALAAAGFLAGAFFYRRALRR